MWCGSASSARSSDWPHISSVSCRARAGSFINQGAPGRLRWPSQIWCRCHRQWVSPAGQMMATDAGARRGAGQGQRDAPAAGPTSGRGSSWARPRHARPPQRAGRRPRRGPGRRGPAARPERPADPAEVGRKALRPWITLGCTQAGRPLESRGELLPDSWRRALPPRGPRPVGAAPLAWQPHRRRNGTAAATCGDPLCAVPQQEGCAAQPLAHLHPDADARHAHAHVRPQPRRIKRSGVGLY